MRTTIEMKDEHRAKLLEIAARRGEKGFSEIVGEAIDLYLDTLSRSSEKRKSALALQGSLSSEDADQLRRTTRKVRESWR